MSRPVFLVIHTNAKHSVSTQVFFTRGEAWRRAATVVEAAGWDIPFPRNTTQTFRYGDSETIRITQKYIANRVRNTPRAVFVHIPKTGGTSIVNASRAFIVIPESLDNAFALPTSGVVYFQHMDYSKLVRAGWIPKEYDESVFKFTFVRNPYDRIRSLFVQLRDRSSRIPKESSWISFCRRLRDDPITGLSTKYNVRGLSQANPQVRWTENIKDIVIGRFETLKLDYERLVRREIDGHPLPFLNKTVTEFPDLCDESRSIIKEVYAEDFAAFGYDPEGE